MIEVAFGACLLTFTALAFDHQAVHVRVKRETQK